MWQRDTCSGEGEVPAGTTAPEPQRTLTGETRVTWRSSPAGGALSCRGTSWAQRGPRSPAGFFESLMLWIRGLGFDLALCPRASVSQVMGCKCFHIFTL